MEVGSDRGGRGHACARDSRRTGAPEPGPPARPPGPEPEHSWEGAGHLPAQVTSSEELE